MTATTNKTKATTTGKDTKLDKHSGVMVGKGETFTNVVNEGIEGARGRKPFTDQEIASDVRRVSIKLGYTDSKGKHLVTRTTAKGDTVNVNMTAKEYTNHGIFSGIMIAKRFGSFAEFRDEVTHAKRGNIRPTKRMMLKEINRVLRVLRVGEDFEFSAKDFDSVSKISRQAVIARFGNWENVRIAAMQNDWDSTIA